MSDNIFLIGGDIKHHNFGEEPNEEVLEYAFHFYHFGGHLFVALLEEGEVVIKSCKEYLVRAVDGFTIVDLEDLGVGLVREGVLVGLQRVDCQRGQVVHLREHEAVLSVALQLVEEGLHEVEQLVDGVRALLLVEAGDAAETAVYYLYQLDFVGGAEVVIELMGGLLLDQGEDSSEPEGRLGAEEVIFANLLQEVGKIQSALSGLHRLASLQYKIYALEWSLLRNKKYIVSQYK